MSRRGASQRRVATMSLLLAVVALVSVPVGRQLLVAFDVDQARRLLDAVELEEALEWLQAAERRQPDRADVQYLLGVTYRRHAEYGRAEEHLGRARALGWPMPDLEQQHMMVEFQRGKIAQAEPYLTELLERGGSDDLAEDVYEAMIIGYLAEHRLSEANFFLESWIKWRPDSLRARLLRAYFYSNGGLDSLSEIEAELREILRIAPTRLDERLSLAELLTHQTRVDEALAELETCQEQAPDDPRVKIGFGLCHFRQSRLKEAKLELESAVKALRKGGAGLTDERWTSALTTLGQIASSEQDHEAAARYCQEAVEHAPQDIAALYSLGIALKNLGKGELAKEYLERSKALRAKSQRMTDIQLELGQDPENVALRAEAANLLRELGRKAEAANWMASTLTHEPELKVAHEFLADYYDEKGEHELAQRHREAAENGTDLPMPGTTSSSTQHQRPNAPGAAANEAPVGP